MLAARLLGSASSAAHLAFVSLFVWRTITGKGLRAVSLLLAFVALLGFIMSFVGGALLKHGGRTKARAIGVWLVAASAALASTLLVFASFGGD
jgi:hypothetical protein